MLKGKSKIMNPAITITVIRGTPSFANACRIAALGMAMTAACTTAIMNAEVNATDGHVIDSIAMKSAAPKVNVQPAATAFAPVEVEAKKSQHPALDLPMPAVTPATVKLNKLLQKQTNEKHEISPEQSKTLKYAIYRPVEVNVRVNGKLTKTHALHPWDLVRLCNEASRTVAKTSGVRIDPAKIGAVIQAESNGVAQTGFSWNGKTPSFGLAQLEANTAKGLGVKDPNDPLESAIAVAKLLSDGYVFAKKHPGVPLDYALSLAYNTGTNTRNTLGALGSTLRLDQLPPATQIHVKNMAIGEAKMNQFIALHAQYEKIVSAPNLTKVKSNQSDQVMATVAGLKMLNKSVTPTHNFMSAMSGDQPNLIRMSLNQDNLAKIKTQTQPLPMTTAGLSEMCSAVQAQMPANVAPFTPFTKTESASQTIAALARSMLDKVRVAAVGVREVLAGLSPLSPMYPVQASRNLESVMMASTAGQRATVVQDKMKPLLHLPFQLVPPKG